MQLPFQIQKMPEKKFPERTFYSEDYRTNGKEYESIQDAVDACRNVGGGTVVVGPGAWISGTIRLHDNMKADRRRGSMVALEN